MNTDCVADTTRGTSLLGDQFRVQHLAREVFGMVGTMKYAYSARLYVTKRTPYALLHEMNAALETIVELALSSSTSKNLGLDHTSRRACII